MRPPSRQCSKGTPHSDTFFFSLATIFEPFSRLFYCKPFKTSERPGTMTTSIGELGMDRSGHGGCWTSLPAEVRLMILREIVRQRLRGWASCAAVCKEWQAVIEPNSFHRLTLRNFCIPAFEHIAIRPRGFIQHICLNVELPRYTCDKCQGTMPQFEALRHSLPFGRLLLNLFSVLSRWQFVSPLTLELNP